MSAAKWKLERAYEMATVEEDYTQAIKICDEVIAEDITSPEGFNMRARINELAGNLDDAMADITRAIEIEPNEPDYYFNRGRWNLGAGKLDAAIADQTDALEIGDKRNFHFYDECAYFFRAVAFAYLGRFDDALSDCQHVEDDFLMYSTGLGRLTKSDLIREVQRQR
jgi:tetratricopeptide (TPR) repeat protein